MSGQEEASAQILSDYIGIPGDPGCQPATSIAFSPDFLGPGTTWTSR